MIEHALAPFLARPNLEILVVALAEGDRRFETTSLAGHHRIEVIVGGATRQASVLAACRYLDGRAAADDWVLVHDVARPCVRETQIEALVVDVRDDAVGGLLAIPVTDTLKLSRDGITGGRHRRTRGPVARPDTADDSIWAATLGVGAGRERR